MTRKLLFALCVCILTSEIKSEAAENPARLPETKEECEAAGGKWGQVGCLLKQEGCEFIAKDAGKPCRDKSDCRYQCITQGHDIKAGSEATGICSVTSYACGCHARVEDGKAGPVLCVD